MRLACLIKYILFLFFIFLVPLFAQDKNELDAYYNSNIRMITDSAVEYYSAYTDTLFESLDSSYRDLSDDYYHYFKDSIYADSRKSLNETGRRSLKEMAGILFSQFSDYHKSKIDSLKQEVSDFFKKLNEAKNNNSVCTGCITKGDFNAKLDNYRDLLDSIGDAFQDRIGLRADIADSLFTDSLYGCEDSLGGFTDYLLENEPATTTYAFAKAENKENREENVSELDLELIYINHESYRGRDNGIHENSFSPTILYTHSSGLGITGGLKWLNHAKHPLNEYDIGLSFNRRISDLFSGSLSYAHFWFRDSSALIRSDLNNNLEGGLDLNSRYVNAGLVMDLDFAGKNSEFSTSISGSIPLHISEKFLGGILSSEPEIKLTYGQQSSALIARRRIRRALADSLKTSSVFGIMDYELNFPFDLEYKHLIISPSLTYIIPVNVLDASTNHGFLSFMIDLTVPVRFY